MMIPGVRLSAIRRASMLLEEERALRRANDAVVAFLSAQPLCHYPTGCVKKSAWN